MSEMTANPPLMSKLDIGTMASGATTGGGAMLWLSNNASAVGAIVAICSLLITALFLFINWRTTVNGQKINRLNMEDRILKDLRKKAKTPEQQKLLEELLDS